MTLPLAPNCPAALQGLQSGAPAAVAPAAPTAAQLNFALALGALEMQWKARARRKHMFQQGANTAPALLGQTPGRIWTIILGGAQTVYLGGTSGEASAMNWPLTAGAAIIFGPEEGDSPTWLMTPAANQPAVVYVMEGIA